MFGRHVCLTRSHKQVIFQVPWRIKMRNKQWLLTKWTGQLWQCYISDVTKYPNNDLQAIDCFNIDNCKSKIVGIIIVARFTGLINKNDAIDYFTLNCRILKVSLLCSATWMALSPFAHRLELWKLWTWSTTCLPFSTNWLRSMMFIR